MVQEGGLGGSDEGDIVTGMQCGELSEPEARLHL
jgi:hypothetical protein